MGIYQRGFEMIERLKKLLRRKRIIKCKNHGRAGYTTLGNNKRRKQRDTL